MPVFPSRDWCEAVAAALHGDPSARAAEADFGAVVAGFVITRGSGLAQDFCVLARLVPGRKAQLEFVEDEDELESLEPDYLIWADHALVRDLIRGAIEGRRVDPMRAVLDRRVKVVGDFERLVKQAGRHPGAGLGALRSVPTTFLEE